jgi:hypothetical protein
MMNWTKLKDATALKEQLSRFGSKLVEKTFNKDMLFAAAAGFIFLLVFLYGYKQIPKNFYEYRDDGIITMSHGKNLADYGTIGINPSGERVEGYSAPAQFISYYILYTLSGISFKAYSTLQTFLAAFLLGFIFIKFFKSNYTIGLIFSFISAVLLIKNPSFLGWHGSGMENAVTHVLFLAAIYLLYKMYTESKINYYFAAVVFLASIARIESMYYIFPLLVIFSISWYFTNKDFAGFYFLLTVLGIWVVFNGIRYIYFGDIIPNTAYGQKISLAGKIKKLLDLEPKRYQILAGFSGKIMSMHFGYLIGLALPLVYFVKRSKEFLFLAGMLLCMVAGSYANPYIFGPSRIEITRTTTHLAVIAVLLVSLIISKLCIKKHVYWIIPVFIAITLFFTGVNAVKPYYLGWDIHSFNSIRKEFRALQKKHDIARPTICNVDLGMMSWHKEFNILDLGRLGNPVIARLLKEGNKKAVADYVFDLAAPDFIEMHDNPARSYYFLFRDKRFKERYTPVREKRSPWLKKNAKKYPKVMKGLWIRTAVMKGSTSPERRFIDKLQADLSIEAVKEELALIAKENRPGMYTHAARTVYRLIPELVDRGIYDEVVELFEESKASAFDLALLTGRQSPGWYKQMIAFLKKYKPKD